MSISRQVCSRGGGAGRDGIPRAAPQGPCEGQTEPRDLHVPEPASGSPILLLPGQLHTLQPLPIQPHSPPANSPWPALLPPPNPSQPALLPSRPVPTPSEIKCVRCFFEIIRATPPHTHWAACTGAPAPLAVPSQGWRTQNRLSWAPQSRVGNGNVGSDFLLSWGPHRGGRGPFASHVCVAPD